jgi:hypothetical protein
VTGGPEHGSESVPVRLGARHRIDLIAAQHEQIGRTRELVGSYELVGRICGLVGLT